MRRVWFAAAALIVGAVAALAILQWVDFIASGPLADGTVGSTTTPTPRVEVGPPVSVQAEPDEAQWPYWAWPTLTAALVIALATATALGVFYWNRRPRQVDETASGEPEISKAPVELSPRLPPRSLPNAAGFQVESYVSAGPRKYQDQNDDIYELCEDAAGVVNLSRGDQVWWLADGTGGSSYLPPIDDQIGISARLLTRDVGEAFLASQRDLSPEACSNEERWQVMLADLHAVWQARLEGYKQTVQKAGRWERLREQLPKGPDHIPILKWSTTFIGGRITADNGGTLTLYHAGDSGAVLLSQGASVVSEPNGARVILRARLFDSGVEVEKPSGAELPVQIRTFDDLSALIAMSDGVVKGELSGFLTRVSTYLPERGFDKVREQLLRRSDRSLDDKSMVIIRRLGTP